MRNIASGPTELQMKERIIQVFNLNYGLSPFAAGHSESVLLELTDVIFAKPR